MNRPIPNAVVGAASAATLLRESGGSIATEVAPTAIASFAAKETLNKPLLVIPAKAGVQCLQEIAEARDPSFRWDDEQGQSFPEGGVRCRVSGTPRKIHG
jgi:hypothetical protein